MNISSNAVRQKKEEVPIGGEFIKLIQALMAYRCTMAVFGEWSRNKLGHMRTFTALWGVHTHGVFKVHYLWGIKPAAL